jgi:hypothetical protein
MSSGIVVLAERRFQSTFGRCGVFTYIYAAEGRRLPRRQTSDLAADQLRSGRLCELPSPMHNVLRIRKVELA